MRQKSFLFFSLSDSGKGSSESFKSENNSCSLLIKLKFIPCVKLSSKRCTRIISHLIPLVVESECFHYFFLELFASAEGYTFHSNTIIPKYNWRQVGSEKINFCRLELCPLRLKFYERLHMFAYLPACPWTTILKLFPYKSGEIANVIRRK